MIYFFIKSINNKLMIDKLFATLGVFGYLLFLLFGVAQIYVGMLGIEYHFSSFWAYSAVIIAIFLRILLPVTIGSYFGAVDVLGWDWYFALAFAAPGLLFVIPGVIGSALSSMSQGSR